jgi:sialate O-acetylesterase
MPRSLIVTEGLTDDIVLQRDTDAGVNVTVRGRCASETTGALIATVRRLGFPLPDWEGREVGKATGGDWSATLAGLPTGGPYTIEFTVDGQPETTVTVQGVLVGDLWVLAGQSNMQGVGDLVDVEPPSPFVHVFDMADHWHVAEEPLHWLCDSPDSCHCEVTGEEQRQRMQEARRTSTKGAGLGLPFANAVVRATGVPIGLLPCAHGGTSMQQWDPALKTMGGASLYGSMLRRLRLAGGKVRGLLWYQGESESNPDGVQGFSKRFKTLVENVREDVGSPDLPFYTVQIGRVIFPADWGPADPIHWNAIQDLQRRLVAEIPHTAVVPTADLELDDLIHIGTQGLRRLGRRLARVALHAESGPPPGPRLRSVTVEGSNRDCLRVAFDGVAAAGFPLSQRVTGFSLRREDRTEIVYIYKAAIDPAHPSDVLLWMVGPLPEGASLWYGYGFDPAAVLNDTDDMAVPVFGPIRTE